MGEISGGILNRGNLFVFALPRGEENSVDTASVPRTPPVILAVDDDPGVLGLLGKTLGNAGYRVLLADGGWSAIRMFESSEEPIRLLLTDVIMPDLTGPVVAERLRARQPDLKVLFISGFHDADLVQRFVTRKGFTLLPKPFTVDGLLRVVGASLETAQA
jgi:two-component system, cell cycle sensor histidine kinase and response regulator CckA